jgi:methylenetetrahydrofolate reductase (NADPH)
MLLESRIAELFSKGKFVVTSELSPPRGADQQLLLDKLELMKGYCDAVNLTDNVRGIPSMSSLASSHIVLESGLEPIMQLTTRDKNRAAIQSELYGAYALGVRNILFITGDHSYLGPYHDVKPVEDINSIQALKLANRLMSGFDTTGDQLEGVPHFCLGSTFNQHADDIENEANRVELKYLAGAEFFQTQAVFDVGRFRSFVDQVKDLPIKILAGVIPLKSPESAEFMNQAIPGIEIPAFMIRKLTDAGEGYSDEDALEKYMDEGLKMSLKTISELCKIKRIDGVHIMGVNWEESLSFLVDKSEIRNLRNGV